MKKSTLKPLTAIGLAIGLSLTAQVLFAHEGHLGSEQTTLPSATVANSSTPTIMSSVGSLDLLSTAAVTNPDGSSNTSGSAMTQMALLTPVSTSQVDTSSTSSGITTQASQTDPTFTGTSSQAIPNVIPINANSTSEVLNNATTTVMPGTSTSTSGTNSNASSTEGSGMGTSTTETTGSGTTATSSTTLPTSTSTPVTPNNNATSTVGTNNGTSTPTTGSGNTNSTTTPSTGGTQTGYNIMVMEHLCNASVRNMDDFRALEAGRDPVSALANTVLNCPATALPGDMAVADSVSAPRMTYEFIVSGEHHGDKMLSVDGQFMQHKLSEVDINKDVDGNGIISATTTLDVSHYEFPNLMADNGRVEVRETTPPAGYKFGALRFTPSVVDGNNDKNSLLAIDDVQGRIQLDMTNDSDKMIMLHVYNFRTDTSNNTGGSGTTTDRTMIINQINALQQQIQTLLGQIQVLIGQLK